MCGLCLPHCPTYGKTRQEGDSPRGRIALIRALEDGTLPVSDRLEQHLDGCLQCGACESACPSGVPFLSIMDQAHGRLAAQHPRRSPAALLGRLALRFLLPWPRRVRRLGGWLRVLQRTGMITAARRSGLVRLLGLQRAVDRLPLLPAPPDRLATYPAISTEIGHVALFTGCMGDTLDPDTVSASIQLLTLLGYAVDLPPDQACCGALHAHAGDRETGRTLAHRNWQAFGRTDYDAIVTLASGCHAHHLRRFTAPGDTLEARAAEEFMARVVDICDFVADRHWPETVEILENRLRVLVHTPCSDRRAGREPGSVTRLLSRIPGLQVQSLPAGNPCCGAAGSYFLRQPGMSDALLGDQVEQVRNLAPQLLVTTNIGCALHLQAGLCAAGLDIPVCHPVTLLAWQAHP